MIGFSVIAADDVRQAWRSERGERFIQLRESGLFKVRPGGGALSPPSFSEAIVFAKPLDASLRRQHPGLPARSYYDYRLLIDGEFYQVAAFD